MAFDSYGYLDGEVGTATVLEGDCLTILEQDVAERPVGAVVLDPPLDATGSAATALRGVLPLLDRLLDDDAVIATYASPRDVPAVRAALEHHYGPASYRTEAVIAASPRATADSAPLDVATQSLLVHCPREDTVLARPGTWDTVITDRQSPKAATMVEPAEQHDDEPDQSWDRNRQLRAVRNYRMFVNEWGRTRSLDDFHRETLARTGVDLDFLRIVPGGDIQLYVPGHRNATANTVWLDLGSARGDHGHRQERSELVVARFLEWFTGPSTLVLDPFCGSGTTLAAAVASGRDALGIESDPAWSAVTRSRLSIAKELSA